VSEGGEERTRVEKLSATTTKQQQYIKIYCEVHKSEDGNPICNFANWWPIDGCVLLGGGWRKDPM